MDNKDFWAKKDANFVIDEISLNGNIFDNLVYDLQDEGILHRSVASSILKSTCLIKVKINVVVHEFLFKPETRSSIPIDKIAQIFYRNNLLGIAKHIDPQITYQYSMRYETDSFPEEIKPMPYRRSSVNSSTLQMLPYNSPPPPEASLVPSSKENEPICIKVIPAKVIYGHDDEVYKNESMPRGYVFIVNMKEFANPGLHPDRISSEVDVKNLDELFTQMGYVVHKHSNLSKGTLIRELTKFRNASFHEKVDSCVVVVMSHGHQGSSFYTYDNLTMCGTDVMDMFNNIYCPALRDKLKLFIFQFCRGDNYDNGVEEESSSPTDIATDFNKIELCSISTDGLWKGETMNISKMASVSDMSCIYATLDGLVAYRNDYRGSWLIEAICLEFMEHAHNTDLDHLVKKVSRRLSMMHFDHGKKQTPEYTQKGIKKHFYFNPTPLMRINDPLHLSSKDLNLNALTHSLSTSSLGSSINNPPHQSRQLEWMRSSGSSTPDSYGYDPRCFRSRHASTPSVTSRSDTTLSPYPLLNLEVPSTPEPRRLSLDEVSTINADCWDELRAVYTKINTVCEDEVDTEKSAWRRCLGTAEDFREFRLSRKGRQPNPSSIKRQLSAPSHTEAMKQLSGIKHYLEVNESEELIVKLQEVETLIMKNKNKSKKQKKGNSYSLDY